MKLLVAVLHRRDIAPSVDALLAEGFRATHIDSAGGFLREGNSTLLVGIEEERIPEALAILRGHCKSRLQEVKLPIPLFQDEAKVVGEPIQVKVGGAVIFVLSVDRFERL